MNPGSYIGTAPLSSQINPVHTLPPYNFKIRFNIILALSQGPSKCLLLSDFPTKTFVCITSSMPHPPDVITFQVQIKKLLLYNFLQPSVTSTLLDPSIIRNILPFILHDRNKVTTPLPKVHVSRNTRYETSNTCN
jgi:hypothetical protein